MTAQANGDQPSEAVHRVNGVTYCSGAHGGLLADMYLPQAMGTHPAVVYLHGGAWKSGDRTQMQGVAAALAAEGYVGMAIDYDLTDRGVRFPTALREAEQAVAWLRQNAARYGVDPRRIAVAGSSAGGELAALLALDRKSLPDAQVQAAVVFNGVLDLADVGSDSEDMVKPYLGGTCAAKQKLCRAASPVNQVHRQAPPFFVGHGTADQVVPYSQAQRFIALLQSHGVSVTPFVAGGAGHTYWKDARWRQQNIAATLLFLAKALPETR